MNNANTLKNLESAAKKATQSAHNFSEQADPLSILREDTYSNEETNEITGKMIREQYKAQQNEK